MSDSGLRVGIGSTARARAAFASGLECANEPTFTPDRRQSAGLRAFIGSELSACIVPQSDIQTGSLPRVDLPNTHRYTSSMVEGTQRRLAAIVSADVVGYSRLMGADETGTLDALRAHRNELIDPKITEYGGRIVKTMGDGLLLEFPSVVNAMRCVIDVQQGMAERNKTVEDVQRIAFRVGVNNHLVR